MSMHLLLPFFTDKWAGYETNQEVTDVTLRRNGPT
jgi:hypothetical protein